MDGNVIGRVVLYFALACSVFVAIKAAWEAYKTATMDFNGETGNREKEAHRRAHIASLIGISFVSLFMVFSYVWFDVEDTGLGFDDRTIGVFNVLFTNILWLFFINHFKQERKGVIKKANWKELLKF